MEKTKVFRLRVTPEVLSNLFTFSGTRWRFRPVKILHARNTVNPRSIYKMWKPRTVTNIELTVETTSQNSKDVRNRAASRT